MVESRSPKINWVWLYNSVGITLILIIAVFLYSEIRQARKPVQADSLERSILQLSPQEVEVEIKEGAVLLDVRSEHEWQTSNHVDGAISIPINQFSQGNTALISQLLPDKDAPIIVMCHSQNTYSMRAAAWLRQQGYTNVSNLNGGLKVWLEESLPTVPFVTLENGT